MVLFVISLRSITSVIYFNLNGPLASFGADIWYFIGVAKGYYHLFWADPLQWLLPLLSGLQPEVLFYLLLIFSNLFHIFTVLLIFRLLNDLHQDEIAAFWASAAYSCFSTSFNFCTASFHHQQASLPVLIGLIWIGYRVWCKPVNFNPWFICITSLLFLIGLWMGPDVWVVLTGYALCSLVWLWRYEKSHTKFLLIQTAALIFLWIIFICLAPRIERVLDFAAFRFRGIDLAAQRELHVADLMPFSWSSLWASYSWSSPVIILGIIWGWWKGRFPEVALITIATLFASRASRFYTIAEIAFAILWGWFLAREIRLGVQWKHVLGCLFILVLLGLTVWRGIPCFYSGNVASVLRCLNKDVKLGACVLCTPTYGFFIRGWTGAKPTSDWHHLDPIWVQIASQPADKAIDELRRRGITHLFFTSNDCRIQWIQTSHGTYTPLLLASGGFENNLPETIEDVKKSLIWQSLSENPQIPGAYRVSFQTDKTGQIKTVLFKLK